MWFVLALVTTLCWGVADLFYKKGSDPADRFSYLKIVMAVGLVMGVHAVCYMLIGGIAFDPFDMIRYLPVSALYILSMTLGYVGLRHTELSVASPVQNSSGAVTAILCLIFLRQMPDAVQTAGIVVITGGLIWLAVIETREEKALLKETGKRKLFSLLFPLLYCAIDGIGTFADAVYLNEDAPLITEDGALIAYELTFFICAVICFIFVVIIKKERLRIKGQGPRMLAALFETGGQIAYVYVIGGSAVVAAPMIASYCAVSVLLSRIFLKERLTRAQYAAIITVMVGVALLGLAEGLSGG